MTGDDRLRAELEALERAVPTAAAPTSASPRGPRWIRAGLIGATAIAAIGLTSWAVGVSGSLQIGRASPSANAPVSAETRDGDFILSISSPKTVWTANEAIEVSASLRYVGEEPDMSIGQGIPPIGFELAAASGKGPALIGIQQQPCVQYPVSADAPIVEAYRKGVPLTEDGLPVDEVAPFDRAFREDPELRLPPGEWEFTASTDFTERGCGDKYSLRASIVVRVMRPEASTETAAPTESQPVAMPSPTPSPTASPRACPGALADGVLAKDASGRPVLVGPDYDSSVRILWLFPDSVRVEPDPILRILDAAGKVLAIEGDHITLGGGFNGGDTEFHACGVIERDHAQQPTTFDDDPDQVTGVLEGDADLEGGCVWLRDAEGVAWDILWPEGYTRDFDDDVAVILHRGEIIAAEGDVLMVQGRRPSGIATRCMRGVAYEADNVRVE